VHADRLLVTPDRCAHQSPWRVSSDTGGIVSDPIVGRFEFVKIAALRSAQLMRGCTPRVSVSGKTTTTARREVASGAIRGLPRNAVPPADMPVTP